MTGSSLRELVAPVGFILSWLRNGWASDFDIGKTEAQYFRNLNVKQKLATLFEPVALQHTPWSRP